VVACHFPVTERVTGLVIGPNPGLTPQPAPAIGVPSELIADLGEVSMDDIGAIDLGHGGTSGTGASD
jgi:hypothetical protein